MRHASRCQTLRVVAQVIAILLLFGLPRLWAAPHHSRAAKHQRKVTEAATGSIPTPPAELTAQYHQAERKAAEAFRLKTAAFWAYMQDVSNGDLRVDSMNKQSDWLEAQTEAEALRLKWVYSQQTSTHLVCPLCKGTRFMICPQCAGMGSGMAMFGHPGVKCLNCNGLGKVKCAECQGTGFVKPDKSADHRTYKGAHHFVMCTHCINGKIPIMAYNKMEDMECPYCNGSGRIWE